MNLAAWLTNSADCAKFGMIVKKYFFSIYLILILISATLIPCDSFAFWVWTPETNKWINPKYSVKETPVEQLQVGLEFYEANKYKEAIQEFKKLIKHYPRSREAAAAQYNIGLCLYEQGFLIKAFKAYQLAIEKYPFSEGSAEIVQKQYEIGVQLLEGHDSRNTILKTFVCGDYDIVEVFRTVIKNAPYGDLAATSQYKIGLYLQEKKMYQEARDEFEKVMNDYPDSKWASVSKYQIAMSDAKMSTDPQYDQKITQAAIEELEEFVEIYPDAELSDSAKEKVRELRNKEAENNFVIAQFYEKQKNYAAAKLYYKLVVNEYGKTPWAVKALKKIREMSEKEEEGWE